MALNTKVYNEPLATQPVSTPATTLSASVNSPQQRPPTRDISPLAEAVASTPCDRTAYRAAAPGGLDEAARRLLKGTSHRRAHSTAVEGTASPKDAGGHQRT
jgi:hypothetical protein